MNNLSQYGQGVVNDLTWRYGLSADTVITMIQAVINGNGTMAQFYSPELGGAGQWMSGGMTMVGDMFNQGLKNTVNNLCSEISGILMNGQLIFEPAPVSAGRFGNGFNNSNNGNWWPAELGWPSSSGSQNQIRYAIFPDSRRLALDVNGQVTVYDTLDNQIGGVGQQQGNGYSLTFSSQYGTIAVDSLPVVSGSGSNQGGYSDNSQLNTTVNNSVTSNNWANNNGANNNGFGNTPAGNQTNSAGNSTDILGALERMADLHARGILSDAEFSAKKAELLQRL